MDDFAYLPEGLLHGECSLEEFGVDIGFGQERRTRASCCVFE